MRIIFEKIRYKNLLSSGNTFTEIDFNRSKTTLISGSNGSGKSTLLDAIVFALYGKPFRRINKPQLINTINSKDTVVEIEFSVGDSKRVFVRRGMKPNLFEIYVNDELINQDAAKRDYQAFLEESILGINFKSFTQIVILGSATYVPFMEMPAAGRREVIEDLLDIKIFSIMNGILKEKIQDNKEQIREHDTDIRILSSKIQSIEEHSEKLKKLRSTNISNIKKKVQENLSEIENLKEIQSKYEDELSSLIDSISGKDFLEKKKTKARDTLAILQSRKTGYTQDIEFYETNNECPTCRQDIDEKFRQETLSNLKQKYENAQGNTSILESKITEYNDTLNTYREISDQIGRKQADVSSVKTKIAYHKNTLKALKKEYQDSQKDFEDIDITALNGYYENLKQLQKDQEERYSDREQFAFAYAMLKDGGIKTSIIRHYIPIMNKFINKYLNDFDLFVDFHLDESFNETIRSRHRDNFSYASFSEGEKLRITLSIMLAWRMVSKLRNSTSTNLLILDETLDGSLDGVGIETLIDTLHNMNNNDNIFVITHRGDIFQDKFDTHITFSKKKDFSVMSISGLT